MGTRGRTSADALAVISSTGVQSLRRPEPPAELNEEQAIEWRAVVNRLAADWFQRETHGMLAQYCRHIVSARRVADMIASLESEMAKAAEEPDTDRTEVLLASVKTMDRLFKMQEREGRAISSLATRMRISQQSAYDKSKKKPAGGKRPWEVDG